ncbi:hypothetical protein [Atlantibacter sp.]|uniref:hypothetical protein n=1 Tax=Atlantibacter sp. TaxID=1903473 RepID=UPI0028B170D8|nr:hypothetical protein [Atlantibacter sp.]
MLNKIADRAAKVVGKMRQYENQPFFRAMAGLFCYPPYLGMPEKAISSPLRMFCV